MKPLTKPIRLLPRRLTNGLLAWQATMAYISAQHSPDALLELVAFEEKADVGIQWSATVSWGKKKETVQNLPSSDSALDHLWEEVERNHTIFISEEDTLRRPAGYAPGEWIDSHTMEILGRVIETTRAIFPADWRLVMIYQPSDVPAKRVQMRLLAKANSVTVGGRGAALIDAARDLYRNAVPVYAAHSGLEVITRSTSENVE